jgi:hypothetical protein
VSQGFDALLFIITNESSRLSKSMVTRIIEFLDEQGTTLHVLHSFSSTSELLRRPEQYHCEILFERAPTYDGPIRYMVQIRRPWAFAYHSVPWHIIQGWQKTTRDSFDPSGRFGFDEYVTYSLDLAIARREQWLHNLRREAEGR